jgi:exodeoxyribonuclease V alpha subunit
MTGTFIVHPKFGKQFTLQSLIETQPSTAEGIERYLSSGLINGIGKKTAERIVKEFGSAALDVIRTEPDKVAKLVGVGKKKAELLQAALAAQTEFDRILRFLVEHRISPNLSAKIYERYKGKTIDTITNDPYTLARDIRGIGFQTADTIALNLGMSPHGAKRLRAGIWYALEDASDEGHCYRRDAQSRRPPR